MICLYSKFDQVSEIKAKHALVGSFVMIFDYNFPIPVEKVSKKVQMERYRPFQNSLEVRQFDSVMLRNNELTITWLLRQAISLSAKLRCLVVTVKNRHSKLAVESELVNSVIPLLVWENNKEFL